MTYKKQYDHRYRAARRKILGPAGNGNLPTDPPCWYQGPNCTHVATTADHEPPLSQPAPDGRTLHPACKPCNVGRRGSTPHTTDTASRNW